MWRDSRSYGDPRIGSGRAPDPSPPRQGAELRLAQGLCTTSRTEGQASEESETLRGGGGGGGLISVVATIYVVRC